MAAQTLGDVLYSASVVVSSSPVAAAAAAASLPVAASSSAFILAASIYNRNDVTQQQQQQQQQQLTESMLTQTRATVANHGGSHVSSSPSASVLRLKSEPAGTTSFPHRSSLPAAGCSVPGIGLVIPSHLHAATAAAASLPPVPPRPPPPPSDRRRAAAKTGFCHDGQVVKTVGGGATVHLGGHHLTWPPNVKQSPEPNLAASVAAAAAVAAAASAAAAAAAAAAYGYRPSSLLLRPPPAPLPSSSSSSLSSFVPIQSSAVRVSSSAVGGTKGEGTVASSATRRCQGACAAAAAADAPPPPPPPPSLMSPIGVVSNQQQRSIIANGWSVPSSGTAVASNRDHPAGGGVSDDQPLDLSSMKRKRFQDTTTAAAAAASNATGNNTEVPDCPLDLSTKRRRTEVGFVVEGHHQQQQQQQRHQVVSQGHFGSHYALWMPAAIQEQTGLDQLLDSVLRARRSLNEDVCHQQNHGSVLVPPMVVGGLRPETKNHPRHRTGGGVPSRLPCVAMGRSFPLFPSSSSEPPYVQPIEVPVIRSVASLQHVLASSGSRSGSAGHASIESNAAITNTAAAAAAANADGAATNLYSLSNLQQQLQAQQRQRRQTQLPNGCNNNHQAGGNVAKLLESAEMTLARDRAEKETKSYSVAELGSQFRNSHSFAKATPTLNQPHQLLRQNSSITASSGVGNPTGNFPECTATSIPPDRSFTDANSAAAAAAAAPLLLTHSPRPSFASCNQKNPKLSGNTGIPQPLLCSGTGVRQLVCPSSSVESLKVLDSEQSSPGTLSEKGFSATSTLKIDGTWNSPKTDDGVKSLVDGAGSGEARSKTPPPPPLDTETEDADVIKLTVWSNAGPTHDPDRKSSNDDRPEKDTTMSSETTKVDDDVDSKGSTTNLCGGGDGETNSTECGRSWAFDTDPVDSKWSRNLPATSLGDSTNKPDLSGDKSHAVARLTSDKKTKDKYDEAAKNDDVVTKDAASSAASPPSSSSSSLPGFLTVGGGGEAHEIIGGCEECRRKNSAKQERGESTAVLVPSSCSKLPTPCGGGGGGGGGGGDCCERDHDGRSRVALSQKTTPLALFAGTEVMSRSCSLFDRQAAPRRVPVANVQPFMKETVEAAAAAAAAAAAKASTAAGPSALSLQAKAETTPGATEANVTIPTHDDDDDDDLKELPTFNRNQGDTPHHMEFVRFLGMKVDSSDDREPPDNPFRSPVEKKLNGKQRKSYGDDDDEGNLDDDGGRGRVRRRLRLHLTAPKRCCRKYSTSDGRRRRGDGGGTVFGFESMRKTPIEYIDDDGAAEETLLQEKRRLLPPPVASPPRADDGEAAAAKKKQLRKAPPPAHPPHPPLPRSVNGDGDLETTFHSRSLCQAVDLDADDRRLMAAQLPSNRSGGGGGDSDTTSHFADGRSSDDVIGISDFCSGIAAARFEKRKTKRNRDALCVDEERQQFPADDEEEEEEGGGGGGRGSAAAAPSTGGETRSDPGERCGDSAELPRPTAKRKYRRRKTLVADFERRGNEQGNQSIAHPAIDSSPSVLANSLPSSNSFTLTSSLSSSSSSLPKVIQRKKRMRIFEDARSNDVTADDDVLSSGPDVRSILSEPRFQSLTSAPETTTCRRRGRGATVRREGALRNARRGGGGGGSACDRWGDYDADLRPEEGEAVYRRLVVSRGLRRGARVHGTRLASATPRGHRRPSAAAAAVVVVGSGGDFYGAEAEAAAPEQLERRVGGLRLPTDAAAACYRFDCDEIGESSSFDAKCRGGQDRQQRGGGRIGRISFQYPEVFGRRRARAGGLRGRSRSSRGSLAGPGAWTHDDARTYSTVEQETTGTHDATTIYRCKTGSISAGHEHAPPAASVRGKVRSRVRMAGRGSRGRRGGAQRLNSFVAAINGPSTSTGLGRDASETRLHQVARLGYDELVSYYLTTGIIHPNVQDNSGVTPLHDSCSSGHLSITRMLLDHGAHPNSKTVDGTRPLHLAIANDRIEVVRMLLSYGADIAMTNSAGRSPVQMAKTKEMKQMLKGFISDLSSGRVKELPWQFPASFEVKSCDLLYDAPSDEETESTEIEFDLEEDSPPPVHRFVSDPQKGLRNFHVVSDLCRDVQVDDFLLLNGDLTFVHIAAPLRPDPLCVPGVASGSTAPEPSQLQAVRGPDRPSLSLQTGPSSTPTTSGLRIAGPAETERSSYVEIDSNLKELLDVHRIPAFANRPKASLSVVGNPASKTTNDENLGTPGSPGSPVAVSTGRDAHGEPQTSITPPASLPISSSDDPSSYTSTISAAGVTENHPDPDLRDSGGPRSGTNDVGSSSGTSGSADERPEVKDLKRLSCSQPLLPPPPPPPAGISTPPPPPCLPLSPLADSVVGGAREAALEPFCRIVLRDISIQPATVDVVAESRSSSARKEPEQGPATSVSGAVEEEEEEEEGEGGKTEEEEEEGQRPFHDETASLRPSSSIGVVAGPLGVDGVTVERRLLLDPTNLGSGHPRRRRPVVKDPVDAGSSTTSSSSSSSSSSISPKSTSPSSSSSTSSTTFSVAATGPTTLSLDAPSNSIPVLEKHGSGDEEVVPATKDKDEGGEEREMPQLTLYA